MDKEIVEGIVKHHKILKPIDKIHPLYKGQSTDKKYILFRKNQEMFVLRMANIKRFDKLENLYEIIKNFHKNGVNCLNPIILDKTPDHKYCYSIVEYIEGSSAHSVLPDLSKHEQLEIGIAAGEELKKLHNLKYPQKNKDWFDEKYPKFLAQLKKFRDLKLSFYKEKYVFDYINSHLDLMKGRPYRFLHNDYNVKNVIINNKKFNGIIDFDAFRWGDPLHDFYKFPWGSKSCSVPYVKGEIIGYCGGKVPDTFWAMYNLYVMINLYRRLLWAYQKRPSRIQIRLKIIEDIIKEHDLKSNKEPTWFK